MSKTRFSSLNSLGGKFFYLILLFIFIGLGKIAFSPYYKVSGQSAPQSCPTCSPPTQQTIYAPTIGLPEATGSEIVLNCRSSQMMNVTPTFYTVDGQAIVGAVFQMQPSEMRFVTIESLIPAEYRGQNLWGGMSLSYTGRTLEMWAQITLRGLNGIGSADVTFSILTGRGTNTQEAVWYMPNGNSTAILALGNSSNSPIQTRLQYSNGDIQDVSIAPFATRYIRRQNGNAVKLTTTGAAGSLKATGFVTNNSQSFTSSIRFYETQPVVQPNLFATNFKVKNHSSHLLLKNTSAASITAQPRFRPTNGAGNPIELPPVTLNANEVVELNLQPLIAANQQRNDLDSVSVLVENSGLPGSLIGALYSTNSATNITQDVPLRDSGRLRNSTGAYPWRMDNDYSSTVFITNVGNQRAQFSVKIYYNGGTYTPRQRELAVGETATFDVRRLRDERVPDERGNFIPATATIGQFTWSVLRATDGIRLNGRSEVVSLSQRVSSSYSCPVCCPNAGPSYSANGGILPYVDDFSNNGVTEDWADCYGRWVTFPGLIPGLYVTDSSIASSIMIGSGMMRTDGFAVGQTEWRSEDYTYYFYWDDGMDCYPQSTPMNSSGPIEVAPRIEIYRNNQNVTNTTQNVSVGEEINLNTLIVTGGTTISSRQWTVPGIRIANYAVTYTDPTSPTSAIVAQLTQENLTQQSVKFYWVDGGDSRQVQYSVMIDNRSYTATATFNVKRPTVTVTSQTNTTTIYTNKQHQELVFGLIGPFGNQFGITFTRSGFQIPSGFSGDTVWVQVIDYAFTRTLNDGLTTQTASGIGLDAVFPYSSNDPNSSVTADTPAVCLRVCGVNEPSITKMQTRIDADMWLMFKPKNLPSGVNSIYVPLKKVSWNWSAVATRRPDFLFDLTSASNSNNPSGENTTDFPQWTRVVTGSEPYQ